MQFIYQYPETSGSQRDMLDAGPIDVVARACEEAGFNGFAFTEHPVPGARWLDAGGHQTLDPFVALAYAAAVTERLRLLTYLAVAPYRNPFLMAKSSATLDRLSGGRFILGLGTGYQKSEFHALGVDFEERNALFDEALDVLPLHWSGEPFSYKGRHFEARDVIARPRPTQKQIPIWIGGNSRLTRRRVAERAQGWMPMFGPPTLHTTVRTPELAGLAETADMFAEMRDTAEARGQRLDFLYPYMDQSIADPAKESERHREAFAELERAGVTWVSVGASTEAEADTLRFIEEFGQTYLRG